MIGLGSPGRRRGAALFQQALPDQFLPRVVLAAVGVAAIDHQHRRQLHRRQPPRRLGDARRIVVRPQPPAAQHEVARRVARRLDDARQPLLVDAQETVRMPRGAHGVDGRLAIAVRAVLEAHRHRQAAGHLAVRLALGRARADGRPAHEVRDVLRHDGIQELRRRRQAQRPRSRAAAAAPASGPLPRRRNRPGAGR